MTISGETFAQSIIQQFYGYSNVSGLGYNVSPLGDANGDGVPDYVATAAKVPAAPPMDPLLVAISGATGSPIFERAFPTAPTGFGGITGMDAGADVTGDGIPDVLFGAGTLSSPAPGIPATPQGGMLIFSGSDGAFLHALQNPGGYAGFGIEPRVLPDLDGDGIAEYLVKAGGTGSSSGFIKCLVHRGGSHTLLYDWTGFQPNDLFGLNIDAIDDLDLDGVPDIAIGAPGADLNGFNTNGAIRVYSGGTGGKLIELYGNQDASGLGQFTAMGDVEFDGSPDIAVRHFASNAVHFLDLATGAEFLRPYVDVNPFGGFAILLDTVTDLDGDGSRDVIASSWGASASLNYNGVVAISSSTGNALFRMKDPHSKPYSQQILGDFPKKLRVLGDMDGDGRDEWLIGQSNLIQVSTGFGGVAEVVTLRSLVASEESLSPATSQKIQLELNLGLAYALGNYFVLGSASGQAGIPAFGVSLPLTYDSFTTLSLTFANTPIFTNTFSQLDAQGRAIAAFDGSWLPPEADGLSLSFAALVLHPDQGSAIATDAVSIFVDNF